MPEAGEVQEQLQDQPSPPPTPVRAPTPPGHLLLVEDDAKLAGALTRGLHAEGYEVDVTDNGDDALAQASARDYDAVILDVLLPGRDGNQVCRDLREHDRWVPVLMLTALGEVSDRIEGLDAGADDYLVKPFDFGELLARLRALIRRGPGERGGVLEVEGLRADPVSRRVSWWGRETELTPREFTLLAFMLRRRGQLVSRPQLLEHVWGDGSAESPNVVDVYVGYLRRKLEPEGGPRLIHTVRGAGFILELG